MRGKIVGESTKCGKDMSPRLTRSTMAQSWRMGVYDVLLIFFSGQRPQRERCPVGYWVNLCICLSIHLSICLFSYYSPYSATVGLRTDRGAEGRTYKQISPSPCILHDIALVLARAPLTCGLLVMSARTLKEILIGNSDRALSFCLI